MIDGQVVLRAFYATLFGISAASKARHPARFVLGIADYGLVARELVPIVAALVVGAEGFLVLVFLVVAGPAPWIGTIGILALFSAAQARSIGRGRMHPCHCFGDEEPIGVLSISRTLALMLMALATVVLAPQLDPLSAARHWEAPTSLVLVGGAIAVAGVVARAGVTVLHTG